MRRGKGRIRPWVGLLGLGLAGFAPSACLYDHSHICGDGQVVYGDDELCVCPANAVFTNNGCVACGEHEVPGATSCDCEPGYTRAGAGQPCTEAPMGLGAACDPAASTCAAPFDQCIAAASGGYCSSSCTSSDDCTGGYACNADSVCERPPSGLNTPCSTDADCAGTDATFCDTFMHHACLVQGCSPTANDCFSGYDCCDLSAFGLPQPLCVPAGECLQ